tara:strand:- start:206 stop:340 length:135 start_codon:yes stop_codon:yes gene_type:complete
MKIVRKFSFIAKYFFSVFFKWFIVAALMLAIISIPILVSNIFLK